MGNRCKCFACFLVLFGLFLTLAGCSNSINEASDASAQMRELREKVAGGLLTAKFGGISESSIKKDLGNFDTKLGVASKKSRLEFSWSVDNFGSAKDVVESIEFRYRIPFDNGNIVKWKTIASPSVGKVFTDYKLPRNTTYIVEIYARRFDGKEPHSLLDCDFVDKRKKDVTMLDLSDEDDRKLWWIGTIAAKTLSDGGSQILGNYGYDYRKAGSQFNPDAMVPQGWMDMIAFWNAHKENGGAVKTREVILNYSEEKFYTQDYVQTYDESSSSSSEYNLSWLYGGNDGGKAFSKNIEKAFTTTEPVDAKAKDKLTSYIVDGDKKYNVMTPAQPKSVTNNVGAQAAQAAVMLAESALTSIVKLMNWGSSSADSGSIKSMGSSVAGTIVDTQYFNEEWIDPEYCTQDSQEEFLADIWDYLIGSFKEDVNDKSFPPDKLFDKYGTHMPMFLRLGGRFVASFKYSSSQGDTATEVKNSVHKAMGVPGDSKTTNDNDTAAGADLQLQIHSWGGTGTNTLATNFGTLRKIRDDWKSSLSKNRVVVDFPGLFGPVSENKYDYNDLTMNKYSGIWNFAQDADRRQELYDAFIDYTVESSFEDVNYLYSRAKYLQDIILIKPDFTNKAIPSTISYAVVSGQVNDRLYGGTDKVWSEDPFTGPYLYKENGDLDDYITATRVLKDVANNGEPIDIGGGVYAFAVYGFDAGKSLKGFAITESASNDSSFGTHAKLLVEKYSLPEVGSVDTAGYHTVLYPNSNMVVVCNGTKPLARWYMADCKVPVKDGRGVITGYEDACSGKYRIWKSRELATNFISNAWKEYPICDISLCVASGSTGSGWSYLLDQNKKVVSLNGIDVSLCRENML